MQCDEDPECHGFTYDPDNQLYWKVKDLDPRKFRRAHNHELHVYVKEMAHVYYTQMIQATLQMLPWEDVFGMTSRVLGQT